MDINANWNEIAAEFNKTEPDYAFVRELLEAGLSWFNAGGFAPNTLATLDTGMCSRIYAALLDRYCEAE